MGYSTKDGVSLDAIEKILGKRDGSAQGSKDRLGSEAAKDLSSKPQADTTRKLEQERATGSHEPVTEEVNGVKRTYDWIEKDGQLQARLLRYQEGGVSREFKYDDPKDQAKVTEFTEKIKTYYGDGEVVVTNKREGNTDTFTSADSTGRKEIRDNVQFENGKVSYEQRPETLLDKAIEAILGKNRLISGDLEDAKKHVLEVAQSHHLFGGNMEKVKAFMDKFIQRAHANAKAHIAAPTDDKIAYALRATVRPLEEHRTGSAASLSESKVANACECAIKFVGDPYEYDRQGSIGSCFLNSRLFAAVVGKNIDKCMNAFANIYTHGSYKGSNFNTYDLTGHYGRDAFNHSMTTFMSKRFGFAHLTSGFRGTCYDEAVKANRALVGTSFKAASLNYAMSHLSQTIRNIEQDGTYSVYTMGGAHSQELTLRVNPNTGKRDLVLINHWYHNDDKVLKRNV